MFLRCYIGPASRYEGRKETLDLLLHEIYSHMSKQHTVVLREVLMKRCYNILGLQQGKTKSKGLQVTEDKADCFGCKRMLDCIDQE